MRKIVSAIMEVFLSREIQNESDNAYIDEVVTNIKSVPDDEELVMLITCVGGDTYQGERLNRAIIEHPNKTKAVVIGIAASMAASILSAFDEVELDPDAELMFHKARITDEQGNVLDEYTPEQQERIDVFNERIYERFIKAGADKAFLYDVFLSDSNENFWLSAPEAEAKRFGVVVPVERRNGEPLTEEAFENAYRIAAKLDISQIKQNYKTNNMGLFNKNKEVPRVHALADGRQVIVTSAEEEIKVGDTLTLAGSDDSLKGKVRLSNNIEAEVDAENKVVNMEEVANEVTDEEKAEIMARIEDLEKAVRALVEKMNGGEEETEDKKDEMEAKEKELENTLQAVENLGKEVLKAAEVFSTSAILDKPENKGKKEELNVSKEQAHLIRLHEALNEKVG